MKVVIHLANNDRIEKDYVKDVKIENGFIKLFYTWRNRTKEAGFNIDDVRSYAIVGDMKKR